MKKLIKKIYYIGGTIYRGLIGVLDNIFDKEEKISDGIEKEVIGKSVDGREIVCYKITGSLGSARDDFCKKILIVGGIHGNEIGTVKLAKKIINYFYNKNLDTELFVIPVLNIDGYEKAKQNPDYIHRGKIGRFNLNNVDLNRNFPTQNFQKYSEWKTGKNYAESSQKVFCGKYGASEPETQALINFIKNNNIDNLIMLHNVGKDAIINKNNNITKNWAEIYKQYAKFNIKYSLNLFGSAMDWAKENNINYIAVEGSSRWGSDWNRQRKAIKKICIYH